MSQGKTSQNIPLNTDRHSDAAVDERKQDIEIAAKLKKLVEYSTDSFERLVALLHPQVTPSALAQNLWSLDWLERYCIAQHPNTPIYTLKELANDGNRVVRAVAKNRLTQIESAASRESS